MRLVVSDGSDSGFVAGRRAELFCTCLLRLKGYRVLARRFKVPVGEIAGDSLLPIQPGADPDLFAARFISTLLRLLDPTDGTISFAGKDITALSQSAQAIALGLAINELATNALKYGALSESAGVSRWHQSLTHSDLVAVAYVVAE